MLHTSTSFAVNTYIRSSADPTCDRAAMHLSVSVFINDTMRDLSLMMALWRRSRARRDEVHSFTHPLVLSEPVYFRSFWFVTQLAGFCSQPCSEMNDGANTLARAISVDAHPLPDSGWKMWGECVICNYEKPPEIKWRPSRYIARRLF